VDGLSAERRTVIRPPTGGRRRATLGLALATALLAPARLSAQKAAGTDSLVAMARAVAREVAGIRHLDWRGPIDFQVSDRATIREYARRTLDREMSPERWAAYRMLLVHTGLVPAGLDLHDLVVQMYAEQVAGYYDPGRKTFFLADWLPPLLQRGVVAHEATHALQDQHFDLPHWLGAVPPEEDGALARSAVTEGDAMIVMLAYLLVPTGLELEDLPEVGQLLRGHGQDLGQAYPTFESAPPALQRLLLFPYVEGATFVLAAVRHGGWSAVDSLYRSPPASTEQILHPERYWRSPDPPTAVAVPTGPAGDHLLTSGSWGEFGTRLILEAGLGDSLAARQAAEGWDGDRYALFRSPDGRTGYAWSLIWDSPRAAERFALTYAQAVARRFPGPARMTTGAGRFAYHVERRDLELRWSGTRVEIREDL